MELQINTDGFIEPERSLESKYFRWKTAEPRGVMSYAKAYSECPDCHEVTYLGWRYNYCPHCGRCMLREDT